MPDTPPFQLQDFLPYLLNQAAETSGQEFQSYYKARYGMLRTEWRVLFHLGRYGDMTATEICSRAKVHKTKVSRAVSALESRRFLKRETRPDDRRHEALSLTPAGIAAFVDLTAEAQRYNATLLSEFSAEEYAAVRRFLLHVARLDCKAGQS